MDSGSPAPAPKAAPPKAAALLQDLMDAFPNETVTVGELLERLEQRAFGLLLLLLSLPMCIPNIPGISTVFGVAMLIPAAQMILGRQEVWVPRQLRDWTFSREAMVKGIKAALPLLRRIETLAKPRWSFLFNGPFMLIWGLMTLLMAFILILPIPGGNFPPAVAMALLALAMLQEDGALALVSAALGVATTALVYQIIKLLPRMLIEIGQALDAFVSAVLP
jgi:hypothetical protein